MSYMPFVTSEKKEKRPSHAGRTIQITHWAGTKPISRVRYGAQWFNSDGEIAEAMSKWIKIEKAFLDPDRSHRFVVQFDDDVIEMGTY